MDEHERPVKSSFKSIFRRSILKKSTHLGRVYLNLYYVKLNYLTYSFIDLRCGACHNTATELPNPSNPETPAKVKFDVRLILIGRIENEFQAIS